MHGALTSAMKCGILQMDMREKEKEKENDNGF